MEKMNNQAYLQWEFQEPKLEIPTIYKAYVREYPHKIWPYMVQYLHFRILKFPLISMSFWRGPNNFRQTLAPPL